MVAKIVSPKAELTVLRGMCHRDKVIAGTLIRNIDESYFHSPESVEIYSSLLRSMSETGENPTYRLVIEDPELSEEARQHFRDSTATIQTVHEAERATRILNAYRQKRGLYNIAAYIGEQLKSTKMDVGNTLHKTSTALSAVQASKSSDDDFLHFGKNNNATKLVDSILDDDTTEDLIPSGIAPFDEVSGGFPRGGLVTVGANSGGGKSVVASAMAVFMASLGYKVLLVPLEMSKREMTCRIMANVTKTNLTKIIRQQLSTDEKELVRKRMRRWMKKVKEKGGRYTIYKPPVDMTIEEIMASTNAYKCDVMIIDYISLLKGVDGDDQVRALGQVARYAKINAENMHRVNILLCQVNEEGKIKYARAISEHSSHSLIWIATKETKESGAPVKVEQPKSRNSQSFPFLMKINYEIMRVSKVDMDSALGEIESASTDKKKKKPLPNLAVSPDV